MSGGEPPCCNCLLCGTLKRIQGISAQYHLELGFIAPAADRLRIAEAELRDLVQQLEQRKTFFGGQGSVAATPRPFFLPPPFLRPPAPVIEPVPERHLAAEKTKGEFAPAATAKSQPAQSPGPPPQKVKEEVDATEDIQPVVDAEALHSSPHREESKGSRKEKRHRKDKKEKHRGSGSHRSRSRRRREKEVSPIRVEEEPREKESKGGRPPSQETARGSREPEQEGERKETRSRASKTPRPPSYSPPRKPRVEQGWGWRGPLPVSNHPRWTHSVNKGQVKRAKQELYNRRKSWRR